MMLHRDHPWPLHCDIFVASAAGRAAIHLQAETPQQDDRASRGGQPVYDISVEGAGYEEGKKLAQDHTT